MADETSNEDELVAAVRDVFLASWNMYYKAHAFHWNVVAAGNFLQSHELFGLIYEDIYSSLDDQGETLRRLGALAPQMIGPLGQQGADLTDATQMVKNLFIENEALVGKIKSAATLANAANEQGVINLLGSRQDMHTKWRWFLKSHLGTV